MKILMFSFLVLSSSIAIADSVENESENNVFLEWDNLITGVNDAVIDAESRSSQPPWGMARFFLSFDVDFIFNVEAANFTVQTTPEFIFHFERDPPN